MSRISGGAKGRFCPVAGGGWSLCVARGRGVLPACGLALCPVSRSARPGLDHYRHRRRADGVPVSITGPGHFWPCVAIVIRDFWPGLLWASPLPSGGLSLALWACRTFAVSPGLCGASLGLWRACLGWLWTAGGPAVSIWGKWRALLLIFGPVSRCLSGLVSCLACLGLFRPLWGFICPGLVSCSGVVFLLLYRAKEKRPFVGRFSLGGGVSASTGISLAGLVLIRSRYAGRASPL